MTGKLQQLVIVLVQIPVDPRNLIVLTVRVVVTALGAPELITMGDHGHALGEHEGRQEVALLSVAQLDDVWVVCVALCAAVP